MVRARQLLATPPAVRGRRAMVHLLRRRRRRRRPSPPVDDPHPLHRAALSNPISAAPTDPAELRHLRRQYFGMISDVDAQLGRVWDALQASGAWDDTYIVVTADHGEQLGDHGLQQKVGWFEESHHIVGIVRDPPRAADATRGAVVERFTENVDIFPTLCEAMGIEIPVQCDGLPLTPLAARGGAAVVARRRPLGVRLA